MKNKILPGAALLIVLLVILFTPYIINPILLPGKDHQNAAYFEGEWFNRIENLNIKGTKEFALLGTLDRYAHYYCYHGCEPESDNCQYSGLFGKWKLMIDYIQEDKGNIEKNLSFLK